MNVSKAFSDYSFPLRKTAAKPNPATSSAAISEKKTKGDRFDFSGNARRLTKADMGDQNRIAAGSVESLLSSDSLGFLLLNPALTGLNK